MSSVEYTRHRDSLTRHHQGGYHQKHVWWRLSLKVQGKGADFGAVGKGDIWEKTDREVCRLVGPVRQETRKIARQQHRRWYRTAGPWGAFGSRAHWAYLCAKVVARGREHLERAEAGQQGQRLRHMTERDIAAVQAVVDAWSQQHG